MYHSLSFFPPSLSLFSPLSSSFLLHKSFQLLFTIGILSRISSNIFTFDLQGSNKEQVVTNVISPRIKVPRELRKTDGKKAPTKIDFLEIHPLELIRQMTLIEMQLFKEIRSVDCLKLTQNPKTPIQGTIAMINRFNNVSRWVSTEIVLTPNLRKRAFVLRRFIRLAEVFSIIFRLFFSFYETEICFPTRNA